MTYRLMIDAEDRDEANTIATDIGQILSGRDIEQFLCSEDHGPGEVVFSYAEHIKVRALIPNDEDDERMITLAREQWEREGSVEIDSDAIVSRGDDPGAYVAAWVWVSDPDDPDEAHLNDVAGGGETLRHLDAHHGFDVNTIEVDHDPDAIHERLHDKSEAAKDAP